MKTPVEIVKEKLAAFGPFKETVAVEIITALESAGYVLAHPDQVTEGMRNGAYGGVMYGGREGPIRADVLRQEANLVAFRAMLAAAPKHGSGKPSAP